MDNNSFLGPNLFQYISTNPIVFNQDHIFHMIPEQRIILNSARESILVTR